MARRIKSSSGDMLLGGLCANHPLQFEHPMSLDAMPDLRRPQDVAAVGIEFLIKYGGQHRARCRLVTVDPVFYFLTLEQMARVRNRSMVIAGREADGAHDSLAVGFGIVRRTVAQEIS